MLIIVSQTRYLPALRFRRLTSLYDPLIRRTTREALFKRRLLEQAALEPGQRVLDLGCGTGTLAIAAKRLQPKTEVAGLDADREMLVQAERKAEEAGVEVRFDQGLSNQLPYQEGSFDRVLSTLFFHHLTGEDKRLTLAEVARVLKPSGELHVADWGPPADPLMRAVFLQVRLFDGWEQTRANAAGALPDFFEEAGLADTVEHDRLRTAFGTLTLYSAKRSHD